jgi:PAS domain-containing protein
MQSPSKTGDDFVATLALQRQRLLYHVGSLFKSGGAAAPAEVAPLTQGLMSSLELLKAAEEELVEERRRNETRRVADERRLAHLEVLFDRAPTPLFLTTCETTIREVNAAGGRMLDATKYHLVGGRLRDLVPKEHQASFREELARVIERGMISGWSFPIQVLRRGRLDVTASCELIDDPGIGGRALHWNIRPRSG